MKYNSRVNGAAKDLQRLRKAFETHPYNAEQLIKVVNCQI